MDVCCVSRFVKSSNNNDAQNALEQELSSLQRITGQGSTLRIRWEPRAESRLEGEVRDDTIWIYSGSREKAIETLRHEFLDWLVVQSLRPYEQLINIQRAALNAVFKHLQDVVYVEKEKLIETLMKLLDTKTQQQNKKGGKSS